MAGEGLGKSLGNLLEPIKKFEEAIGIIDKLVAKLSADPDRAAAKLSEALGEVEKTCKVLDEAVRKYQLLALSEEAMKVGAPVLLEIGGGQLVTLVQKGRGHCGIVKNIYDNYLDRWFTRVFHSDPVSHRQIRSVFVDLGERDDELYSKMVDIAKDVQSEANRVLDSIANNDTVAAKSIVASTFTSYQNLRIQINELMGELYRLQATLLRISKVV